MPDNDTPLFAAPAVYSAKVALASIRVPPIVGAKRTTSRSIATFGMISTPLVREIYDPEKAPRDAKHLYEVIDGARRLADLADINPDATVEVKVVPFEISHESAAAMSLTLNYSRAPNPLAEAEHFEELLADGHTPGSLSKLLGIPLSKIDRRLALVQRLIPRLRDLVADGGMTVSVAERAARLSPERQGELIARAEDASDEPHKVRVTAEDVSDIQRVYREATLPALMFEELQPRALAREAVREAVIRGHEAGLTRDEIAELLDEVIDDAG